MWRDLNKPELKNLKEKSFRQANNEFQQLIRTNDVDQQRQLMTKTMDISNRATKYAAKDLRESPEKGYMPPSEVMRRAPIRSDYFVLPRLYATQDKLEEMSAWERKFSELGLSGDALALAVERKERSILVQRKQEATFRGLREKEKKEEQEMGAKGIKVKQKRTPKNDEQKPMSVLEIMANPPPPPKGWNSNTGTLIVASTDQTTQK